MNWIIHDDDNNNGWHKVLSQYQIQLQNSFMIIVYFRYACIEWMVSVYCVHVLEFVKRFRFDVGAYLRNVLRAFYEIWIVQRDDSSSLAKSTSAQ